MQALAIACRKAGVELREETAARRVLIQHRRVDGVETERGRLKYRRVLG
jgi:glycine/D-amino acid oxidase-like deaminating enzyme